jgi:hypothetical protein
MKILPKRGPNQILPIAMLATALTKTAQKLTVKKHM